MFGVPSCLDFLLIAHGQFPSASFFQSLLKSPKTIVAVDGGLNFLSQIECIPDLIIGDFDSISLQLLKRYHSIPQVRTPDQNKSDLEKALEFIEGYSPNSITVCGALGKRIDHTLANIHLLIRYSGRVVYEGDEEKCFALTPQKTSLKIKKGRRISLMPIGLVKNISTRGLKWDLSHDEMSDRFFSLSNESCEENIEISFEEGSLIISIKQWDPREPI